MKATARRVSVQAAQEHLEDVLEHAAATGEKLVVVADDGSKFPIRVEKLSRDEERNIRGTLRAQLKHTREESAGTISKMLDAFGDEHEEGSN